MIAGGIKRCEDKLLRTLPLVAVSYTLVNAQLAFRCVGERATACVLAPVTSMSEVMHRGES